MAASATLESADDLYRTTIVAACDEWENPIPAFQAEHLLECTWTVIGPCYEYPSTILEDLLCEEEGRIYARWQRETNVALQQLLTETLERIALVEAETRATTNRLLREKDELRRRRRHPGITADHRSVFDTIIAQLEAEIDRIFEADRVKVAQIQTEAERLEEGLWHREDVLIELGPRYQIFWSAPERRLLDRDPSIRRSISGFYGSHSSPSAKWKYAEVPHVRAHIDARLRQIDHALIEAKKSHEAALACPDETDRSDFKSQVGSTKQRHALLACRRNIRTLQAQRAYLNRLRKDAE